MNILEKICNEKKKSVDENKSLKSIDFFLKTSKKKETRNFMTSIKKNTKKFNIITEIKRKSPSAGLIKKNFDLAKIACDYENGGASCLSILTEEKYFGGDLNFIKQAKGKVSIPILRKDFIIDEWQIYESYHSGADCILLIVAILNDSNLKSFHNIAKNLKMDVIVEIHNIKELNRALNIDVECIGVNNRNLKSLEIDLNTFKTLSKEIPNNIIKICESGISQKNEILMMDSYNADAYLIGESLMRKKNILSATKELVSR